MRNNKLFLSLFFLIFSFFYLSAMDRFSSDSSSEEGRSYGHPTELPVEPRTPTQKLRRPRRRQPKPHDSSQNSNLYKINDVSDKLFFYSFSNGKEVYKFSRKEASDFYFLEKEITGIDIDNQAMLLNQLLSLDLEAFSKNLEKFVLSAFSYHDFSSKEPGRSLYFFFTGLLSILQDCDNFKIKVNTWLDETKNFNSIFTMQYNEIPFVKIIIKGVDEGNFSIEKNRSSIFSLDRNLEYSEIKIYYHKKKIVSTVKKKAGVELGFTRDVFDKLNLDFPESFISKITERSYIKKLWRYYFNDRSNTLGKIASEKDFHMFILGLIANTSGIKSLSSNVERGHGRPDIIFKIDKIAGLTKYIIELKASRNRKAAKSLVSDGMLQIFNQGYAQTPSTGPLRATINTSIVLSFYFRSARIYADLNSQ